MKEIILVNIIIFIIIYLLYRWGKSMTAKEPKQGTIIKQPESHYLIIDDPIDNEFSPEQLDIYKKLVELNLKNKLQKIESKRKTKK